MKRYLFLILFMLVAGCGEPTETEMHRHEPQTISDADECAVCGMSVMNHPGPKGQLYLVGSQQPAKFCSTVDFFIYALQPEHENRIAMGYVHDMSGADWQTPDGAAFIAAKDAWFVIGHELPGAMGPTLASFAKQAAAQAFIDEHGGRLLRYQEIDLQVLQELHEAGFKADGASRHHY